MANGRCATDVSVQFPALEAVKCTCVSNPTCVCAIDGTWPRRSAHCRSVAVAEYTR